MDRRDQLLRQLQLVDPLLLALFHFRPPSPRLDNGYRLKEHVKNSEMDLLRFATIHSGRRAPRTTAPRSRYHSLRPWRFDQNAS